MKSMFDMSDVHDIMQMDVHAARAKAHEIIMSSNATPYNKRKAINMITSANSSIKIGMGMSNFILAHPENGLKVVA